MATGLTARFQRRERGDLDPRVGEILSDSNSDVSSIEGDNEDNAQEEKTEPRATRPQRTATRVLSDSDGSDRAESPANTPTEVVARVHQRPAPLQPIKRKNSKWYDSDDDAWDHPPPPRQSDGDDRRGRPTASVSERSQHQSDGSERKNSAKAATSQPQAKTDVDAGPAKVLEPGGRRSSFQRLKDKISLSPFGAKRKVPDLASPASSGPDTPRDNIPQDSSAAKTKSPLSDASAPADRLRVATRLRNADGNASAHSDAVVSPSQGVKSSPEAPISRRTSQAVQSPGTGNQYPAGSSDAVSRRGSEMPMHIGGAMSPGQRKVPGAFPGRPGSGVLLEGWLRQKQRRGVKGMKKWNSRYFVLYAKTSESKSNELRYYTDVVQSAWGPIPLGEMGCISVRLIQRIAKPSGAKYKGCRIDITCRNSWGTHYADDYVSSDDENNNNVNSNNAIERSNSTPKSSRMYSLIADSAQTTQTWMAMLDSLLTRSANSPRVDGPPSSGSAKQLKRANSMAAPKMTTRRRSNTLDSETLVIAAPGDSVPKPVLLAINFIFDSTPGIETEQFYTHAPEPHRLKAALKFLNQFATETARQPSKDELERVLDATTAGAVVKQWLKQLEQPLVPFEMYDDFKSLAAEAKAAPFELSRNLKALVSALPRRNLAMLACLLFHLNDVHVYATKNGMDAATLAAIFGEFILRPRATRNNQDDAEELRVLVQEMIAHVDAIIDEKESELLARV